MSTSKSSSVARLVAGARRWLHHFYDEIRNPQFSLDKSTDDSRNEMISSLMVAACLICIPIMIIHWASHNLAEGVSPNWFNVSRDASIALMAAIVSRKRGFRFVAAIIVPVATIIVIYNAYADFGEGLVDSLYYLILIDLFACLFFSRSVTVVIVALQLVLQFMVGYAYSPAIWKAVFEGPITFTVISSLTMLLFMRFYQRFEEQQRSRLTLSESRYRALFDNSPTAMLEMDCSTTPLYAKQLLFALTADHDLPMDGSIATRYFESVTVVGMNKAARDLLDLQNPTLPQSLFGGGVASITLSSDHESFVDRLIALANKALSFEQTTSLTLQNGTRKDVILRWTAQDTTSDNPLTRLIMSLQDITEQKQAEQTLREQGIRFHEIADNVPALMFVTDADGNMTFVNQQLVEFSGLALDQFRLGRWRHLMAPQSRKQIVSEFRNAFKLRTAIHTEAQMVRKDGQERWIWMSLQPRYSPAGEYLGHIATGTDITDQRTVQEELRRSRAMLSHLIQQIPVGIQIFDRNGTCIDVNQEHLNIFGTTAEGLINDYNIFKDPLAAQVGTQQIARQALNGKTVVLGDINFNFADQHVERYAGRNGQAVINVTLFPIVDERGHVTHIVGLNQDVTERRNAEARYRYQAALLEQVSDAIVSIDMNSLIQAWNRSAETIYGWTRDEAIGKNLYDLLKMEPIPGFDNAEIIPWLSITTQPTVLERYHYRKDGKRLTVSVSISAVYDFDGNQIGAVGVNRDMTEIRRTEAREREQRSFSTAIGDTLHTLATSLDLDTVMARLIDNMQRVVPHESGTIVLIKGDVARIEYAYGFPSEFEADFGKFNFFEVPAFQQMLKTHQPYVAYDTRTDRVWKSVDPRVETRSYLGVPILVRGTMIGVLNLDSTRVGFFTQEHAERIKAFADQAAIAIYNAQLFGTVQQYTVELEERVQERTQALTLANQRLNDLDRLRTKFIADISHELRTPITNMSLRLYLLEHDKPEKRPAHLDVFKTHFNRLSNQIEVILDFTKIAEQNKDNLTITSIAINEMVEEICKAYEPNADLGKVKLNTTLLAGLPHIEGDLYYLRRAVTNILNNAIIYTLEGGTVTVETKLRDTEPRVGIEICDTGIGIPIEDLPHIFERFYRGQNVGSSTYPGAGLGLSIVKEIVEFHHGELELDSTIDVGSCFCMWLPSAMTGTESTSDRSVSTINPPKR